MKILGIETSCDETAASVVELIELPRQSSHASARQGVAEEAQRTVHSGTESEHRRPTTQSGAARSYRVASSAGQQETSVCRLLGNAVATSLDLHIQYGGVVPEVAARSHIESILPVINQALFEAWLAKSQKLKAESTSRQIKTPSTDDLWEDIDGIAVTYGAGLGGSLLIGVLTARTLAIIKQKPLYPINHVEAHVYANFLTNTSLPGYVLPEKQPEFPMLALIVSGGHTQLALFKDHFDYKLLGQTHDDAIGEAFDKVAKIIGLPYPGGPSIATAASRGDPSAFALPIANMAGAYDFSFSGLKTAVLRHVQAICGKQYDFPSFRLAALLDEQKQADIAATFQNTAIKTVVAKTLKAYNEFQPASVVIAGGVAANKELREQLSSALLLPIAYTDPKLCTDNGAMVATLGCYKATTKQPTADPYLLETAPNLSM